MASREQRYFESRVRAIRERSNPKRAAFAELERALMLAKSRSGADTVPTNLSRLAAHFGVVGIREKPLAFRGRMVDEGGGTVIEVNSGIPPLERRFTIAHEIGHFLVEGEALSTLPRSKRGRQLGRRNIEIETLCDRIATEALVPREWIRSQLNPEQIDLSGVLGCSREAEAPIGCVLDQVLEEGIWRGRFIIWREDKGSFLAVRTHPWSSENVLARLALVPNGRESLVARATEMDRSVDARVRIETSDGESDYRMQCVRTTTESGQVEVLSVLIYQ